MTRICGIDPGLTRCGVGVVDAHGHGKFEMQFVTVLRTHATEPIDARVFRIAEGIGDAIDQWHPDAISVERVFAQHNVQTVMGIGHIIGAIMLLAHERKIPMALHTPTEVKAAVSGFGQADKAQVTAMTCRLLGVGEIPGPPDAADSLAIAICEAQRPDSTRADPQIETRAQAQWRVARQDKQTSWR